MGKVKKAKLKIAKTLKKNRKMIKQASSQIQFNEISTEVAKEFIVDLVEEHVSHLREYGKKKSVSEYDEEYNSIISVFANKIYDELVPNE